VGSPQALLKVPLQALLMKMPLQALLMKVPLQAPRHVLLLLRAQVSVDERRALG
jgi:hypothetical protein